MKLFTAKTKKQDNVVAKSNSILSLEEMMQVRGGTYTEEEGGMVAN